MSVADHSAISDARPPDLVVRLTNLIMRPLLRTPAARFIKPLVLLEFPGRHTGIRRRVVVGWHPTELGGIVLTPAPWRQNFTDGYSTAVYWRGHRHSFVGTLEADPAAVATALNTLLSTGSSPRSLALRIPDRHTIVADDVITTNRAAIHFHRA